MHEQIPRDVVGRIQPHADDDDGLHGGHGSQPHKANHAQSPKGQGNPLITTKTHLHAHTPTRPHTAHYPHTYTPTTHTPTQLHTHEPEHPHAHTSLCLIMCLRSSLGRFGRCMLRIPKIAMLRIPKIAMVPIPKIAMVPIPKIAMVPLPKTAPKPPTWSKTLTLWKIVMDSVVGS
eukprot:1235241-Amorphochlora_amoeboformis.AAC.1